jgi:DNA-directed RNA polymerase specialized sigma24 family protein
LLTLLADLAARPVVLSRKGDQPVDVFQRLFDAFKLSLIQQLRTEQRQHLKRKRVELELRVEELQEPLIEFREENQPELFMLLVKKAVPGLIGYIRRRVNAAQIASVLRKEAMKPEDLVDELYLRIYNKYRQAPLDDSRQFINWLYGYADELLQEVMDKHGVEGLVSSVEVWQRKANHEMEEVYNVEADGDWMMQEDFDDPTYHTGDPLFNQALLEYNDFFVDDETAAQTEALTEFDLLDEERQQSLHRMLYNLPEFYRSTFDLYTLEKLSIEDIALIKRTDTATVTRVLHEIREFMYSTLIQMG